MKRYNYVVTVGDEELKKHILSIRSREKKDLLQLSLEEFKDALNTELIQNVE